MELVDVFSTRGRDARLARKGDSDLYLAFRGAMCLPSVKVDLDYHPASDDEVDVLRQALAVGGDAVACRRASSSTAASQDVATISRRSSTRSTARCAPSTPAPRG